ncbi:hypothetical protein [Amycolatopsis anabasis]|uniref:hypothetical protein n=1 Tax=Amycolatopsis anabasis TaxID=1840409 RepID=UPI00131B2624|nr:hypothetical protein [Amycolatopsis anabasis]
MTHGYRISAQDLDGQVKALAAIGDQTTGLVNSANRLAERLPLLGTAPPAMHLAMRLREAAGQAGLTGEVSATDTELNGYHRALKATVASYLEAEAEHARKLRNTGGGAT